MSFLKFNRLVRRGLHVGYVCLCAALPPNSLFSCTSPCIDLGKMTLNFRCVCVVLSMLNCRARVNGSNFNARLSTRRFRSSLADNVDVQTHVHDTCKLFDPAFADEDMGLVILNNRNSISLAMIDGSILGRSRTVVCADGGTYPPYFCFL